MNSGSLVDRARPLLPDIRGRAARTGKDRRVRDETVKETSSSKGGFHSADRRTTRWTA
jgi:hypothetical protein